MTHYEILKLRREASPEEIRKAYREVVKKWHPDLNRCQEAKQRFLEIQTAYETLSDPDRKDHYDALLRLRMAETKRNRWRTGSERSQPQYEGRNAGKMDDAVRNFYFDKDWGTLLTRAFLARVGKFRLHNIPDFLIPFFREWSTEAMSTEPIDQYILRTGRGPALLKSFFLQARGSETIEDFMERWNPARYERHGLTEPCESASGRSSVYPERTASDHRNTSGIADYIKHWMDMRSKRGFLYFLSIAGCLEIIWVMRGLDAKGVPHNLGISILFSGMYFLLGLYHRFMSRKTPPSNLWMLGSLLMIFWVLFEAASAPTLPLQLLQRGLLVIFTLSIYALVVYENNKVYRLSREHGGGP